MSPLHTQSSRIYRAEVAKHPDHPVQFTAVGMVIMYFSRYKTSRAHMGRIKRAMGVQ